MSNSSLIATDNRLFFTRKDSHDLRWGDLSQSGDLGTRNTSIKVGLWGYPDDQGILLNGGRPGARFAPSAIRKFLYKLTPPPTLSKPYLADYGDWNPLAELELYLQKAPPVLANLLQRHPMVTFGGGHDFGAVDGEGFLQWCATQTTKQRPLIINFDAHLDVRPWKGGLNSGTPFSWLLDHHPNEFDFIEVGIQRHCSSPHHHEWLRSQANSSILNLDFLQKVGLKNGLLSILAGTPTNQPCFISFDIDAFQQSLAPGCSQSWDSGLEYAEVIDTLDWLYQNKNVRLFGIYEVSPPLDIDHRTSKLAACLADSALRYWGYLTI